MTVAFHILWLSTRDDRTYDFEKALELIRINGCGEECLHFGIIEYTFIDGSRIRVNRQEKSLLDLGQKIRRDKGGASLPAVVVLW